MKWERKTFALALASNAPVYTGAQTVDKSPGISPGLLSYHSQKSHINTDFKIYLNLSKVFLRVARKLVAEIGMGDLNHGLCPLPEGQAGELRHAVFRRHVLDHAPGRGYRAAAGDERNDIRFERAVFLRVGGGKADEPLSASGAESSLQKV